MLNRAPYEQATDGVVVRVTPTFLPDESDADDHRFVWAYTIEIENGTRDVVQLLSRFWRITDANGLVQTVEGPGVVGQQPVLRPGERFRYTSACPLTTPSGMMVGTYRMLRLETGARFDIAVPAFALDPPDVLRRAH
ncbi:MAG: Co2+/Mg2+ efflux protein ApaG [Hyphomonadaceae bacterium]|nr:Co2+/Mg2+ efflux protein ApaG [Hyphomonadaceae bacterium]